MKHPKPVRQLDRSGCGIACVACLAGVSYAKAKSKAEELFQWSTEQRSFYTSASQITQLLNAFGFETEKGRMVRQWHSISSLAIVAINPDKDNYRWHWVVYSRIGDHAIVIDPQSKNLLRTDFTRMRLRSFLPLQNKP